MAERSWKVGGAKWSRILHAYTSMLCLLMVLFFAFTGLTLNHPEWTFGFDPSVTEVEGTLPANFKTGTEVDWLRVSEFLRETHSLRGTVNSNVVTGNEGSISWRSPGYGADVFFQVDTGTYQLSSTAQGLIGVMNDLHKGRDSRSSWLWAIDVSAVFLIAIAFTGLVLQLFLKKRRRSTLWSAGGGFLVLLIFTVLATR